MTLTLKKGPSSLRVLAHDWLMPLRLRKRKTMMFNFTCASGIDEKTKPLSCGIAVAGQVVLLKLSQDVLVVAI